MADYLSSRALAITAVDELDQAAIDGNAGPVTGPIVKLSAQLAGAGTITQAQYDAMKAERDARQVAITAMKAAAQAEKDADAASAAGQGVLDAAGAF